MILSRPLGLYEGRTAQYSLVHVSNITSKRLHNKTPQVYYLKVSPEDQAEVQTETETPTRTRQHATPTQIEDLTRRPAATSDAQMIG